MLVSERLERQRAVSLLSCPPLRWAHCLQRQCLPACEKGCVCSDTRQTLALTPGEKPSETQSVSADAAGGAVGHLMHDAASTPVQAIRQLRWTPILAEKWAQQNITAAPKCLSCFSSHRHIMLLSAIPPSLSVAV